MMARVLVAAVMGAMIWAAAIADDVSPEQKAMERGTADVKKLEELGHSIGHLFGMTADPTPVPTVAHE